MTMEALVPVLSTLIGEAMKLWGAWTLCLILLGGIVWLSERRSRVRETKSEQTIRERDVLIEQLRAEVKSLQEQRLQDVREMIRVARTGTETMQTRMEGDAEFRQLIAALVKLMTPPGSKPDLPPTLLASPPTLLGQPLGNNR